MKGVIAVGTGISHIDGVKGILLYRGYEIGEIIGKKLFEEMAYLLWYGEFPNESQLRELTKQLKAERNVPDYIEGLICQLPKDMEIMAVLRTVISALGIHSYGWKPTIEQAIKLAAVAPIVIAYRKRYMDGKTIVKPDPELDHVANYLYMLKGELPSKAHMNALEKYMILTMEHGMNASTFSARVTVSTESDLVSAITSAIDTMKGPLHGGAPSEVIQLLNEVSQQADVEQVLREKILNGERLMGFGHRIYKTIDPRSAALKNTLQEFEGEDQWLDLAMKVEEIGMKLLAELKPSRKLYTNVEFYAAAIMKAFNMEKELFTASRIVGWSAHVLEQSENNVMFRPESEFIGEKKNGLLV